MPESKVSNLHVEWLATDKLTPDPRNPRHHPDRQINLLAKSIDELGFNSPILTDRTGKILAGHGRWLAAQKLGRPVVPILRLEHLTDAQAKAFMLADNRLAEISAFDDQLVAEALRDLSELQLDFSIETTGFTMGEIDLRIEGISDDNEPDSADNIPGIPAAAPISKVGDLFHLGAHAVFCGNALEAGSYDQLMRGTRAAMVFSDPPYNQKISGHVSGKGKIQHREFPMATGEMSRQEYENFLGKGCQLIAANCIDGAIVFICMDWPHAEDILAAGRSAAFELKNICVWVKNNGGMGSLYRSRHELVFVLKNGTAKHRNNVELGRYGRNRTNVWEYPGANSFGRQSDEGNLLALHPTVKPVRMIADAMLDCSARGDIVLDPFLGSGSTLIAAERVGRVCYGMELDPTYIDTTIRRWQTCSGNDAIHAITGKRFDELSFDVEALNG
jgi:DNA modification methylase